MFTGVLLEVQGSPTHWWSSLIDIKIFHKLLMPQLQAQKAF